MDKPITGMMIYYYMVCTRKLWYFYNSISMEQENENVKIGKALDEQSYAREDKHINIDDVINIDFIRSKGVLHEVKKSRKIEKAGIWQLKYYLYYLKQKGVGGIKGKIAYPLLKQTLEVDLTQDDENELAGMIEKIYEVVNDSLPLKAEKKAFCKACAYFDLCYI
ncbi:MAG: CRISPR-associated protein Cas4 [Clostridia bacterium]|nr:CRISPR-associated protein Cas4 [Clostridia bacterium]